MPQESYGVHDNQPRDYDAVLYLSFGGPEAPDDVLPFLENVTRGRGVPRERLEHVAEHYYVFGGSPINAQNRAVIAALEDELATNGPRLPVYFGNRNWHPYLTDTMRRMKSDGIRRAIVFVSSPFSSYSACRQYREDLAQARADVGPGAPAVDKIRLFYNHPGFIEPQAEKTRAALHAIPKANRDAARLVFTAHSIPVEMAKTSSYVRQLEEACTLVAERAGPVRAWDLVWQSRSGSPRVPWLEPDVADHLTSLGERVEDVVVVPIGFVSDHIEVIFDLDVEAAAAASRAGINMVRAETVGTHPSYVRMIRDLIVERMDPYPERVALGSLGPSHDICGRECCPAPGGNYPLPSDSVK